MSHSLALPMPSVATGSLENYISSVKNLPMLTPEEEVDLATRFHRDNDLAAARSLVLSHLRVVVTVARGYSGYGLPQADLIQEGNIGLMKAVKRYDPERGVRLVSFALHWIRAEINEYVLRNWRMVKIATTKAQRKLFFNLRSLKQGLETLKPQEVTRIAKELNVSEGDVTEMEARFNGHEMALEADADDEDSYSPISYLAADTEYEPANVLERAEVEHLQTEGLSRALASLDERSRSIIEARWLQQDDESATLHELAAELNVSAERIRQIEKKALSKMQACMAA
jgi:RNA polymerase sigma-32 factor